MLSAKILPLFITVSSFAVICCQTKPGVSAREINGQLNTIQQEFDRGNFRTSLNRIAALKDSVDKLSANLVLKQRVALVQADMQNMYSLCFATAFDTAKQYATHLFINAAVVPDSLKAAAGTTTGFHLYLAALLKGEPTMDSALALFNSSNRLYATLQDKAGEALTSFYIGLCYENNTDSTKNDLGVAEGYYRKSLALATQAGDGRTQSYARRHLAGLYFDKHQIDSALGYAYESYQLREQTGWFVLRPFSLSLIGDFYRVKNLDSAKKYHTLALQSAQGFGYPGAIAYNQQALATDDSLWRSQKRITSQ
ncbi:MULTISPECIES: hypothetical protein [Niastella]|uniref:MalT-like TPR region domain-containing protein n=1 Tax=Niastella soli TaxID=2821487 RepID=A0ABS3Z5X0_9BACT|nr:hypothetical protein [Niastella soli]MBO9205438.1 hypothetical protein [Niastella soli]